MMIKIAAAVVSVPLAVALSLGTAQPAEAKIRGKGTVTESEIRKIDKQMYRQKCLTKKEARKIAKGNGTKIGKRKIKWDVKDTMDDTFTVHFTRKGCAWKTVHVDWDDDYDL